MQRQQLSQAEQSIAELRAEVERLRKMLGQVLSTAGGSVDGQIDLGDVIQFAQIGRPDTPRAGTVRVYARDNGHPYAMDENGVEYDLTGLNGLEGVFASAGGEFLVLGHNSNMTQERLFSPGEGLTPNDGGENGTYSLTVNFGTPALSLSTSNGEGTSEQVLRADATLAIFDATTPSTIQADDTAATGSAAFAARRDHVHALVCAAPVTDLSVSSTNAEGDASSLARSNHGHAIAASSNPGAATAIIKSDTSGYVQLTRIGLGMAPTQPVTVAGYVYAVGDGGATGLLTYRYSGDTSGPYWSSRKARGSAGAAAIVQADDYLWQLNVQGHDGTDWRNAANLYLRVDGTPGASDMPGRFEVHLSPDGSASPALAFRVRANKNAEVYGELYVMPRTFGFAKVVDENGLVGNGPVEYGEVVAIGGIMEVAPACALAEAVTIN